MKRILCYIFVLVSIFSCVPKNMVYFQDRYDHEFRAGTYSEEFKLKPNDQIAIRVKSRNDELEKIFNMGSSGYVETSQGNSNTTMTTTQNNIASYTIDDKGEIDFPIVGKLHVQGKNRMQVAELVTEKLRGSQLVEDAVVTVQYTNLYVNILGEMGPKRQLITQDKYTILDLLTENDLNFEGGKRTNITIMRDSCGVKKAYNLDITNLQSVYDSPIYYVHPGDMIYAEPRNKKLRATTTNGSMFTNFGFWVGLPSLIVSLIAITK